MMNDLAAIEKETDEVAWLIVDYLLSDSYDIKVLDKVESLFKKPNGNVSSLLKAIKQELKFRYQIDERVLDIVQNMDSEELKILLSLYPS